MHRHMDRLATKQQVIDQILSGPAVPAHIIAAPEQPGIPRLCKLVRPQRHGLRKPGSFSPSGSNARASA